MSLRRFPILLTSTLIVAAAALLTRADGAEQRSAWGFSTPHIAVELSFGHACPPPAPVCQPVYAPAYAPVYVPVCPPVYAPVREIVWVDGYTTSDAYGCRSWIPGHYEERYRLQPQICVEPPPSHCPEHGGPWYHNDDRGRGHDDARGRWHEEDRGPWRRR